MTRYTLHPQIVADLHDLADWMGGAPSDALDIARKRQEARAAAYAGNAEQQAAMKAARTTGEHELIRIEVELAERRAGAAVAAFDAVFGGGDSPDARRASSGDVSGVLT